jgi:hypothetical protein
MPSITPFPFTSTGPFVLPSAIVPSTFTLSYLILPLKFNFSVILASIPAYGAFTVCCKL